ncbi:MAG: helix-turn-helix domain-containing protein [Candidatus Uhrbacteria bacterium]|nr:helix-turn-helix domain-containing protein [Candidatus Uhrbacteria bacterium]
MSRKITIKPQTLELLGLNDKDMQVYVTVLRLGSAPLRRIAEKSDLNRGTTYDALKRLKSAGLVSYVEAKSHRYFTAEDPQKLRGLATRREVAIQEARQKLEEIVPALRELAGDSKYRPAVRYYEGARGVRDILEDVLSNTVKTKSKTYRVYSSPGIRDLISAAWPRWNNTRKNKGVHVRAIAIGEGGKTHGLDERKWLTRKEGSPTYIFIYAEKTAYVAIDESNRLFGVIIEGPAIASTQTMIFDALWETLD